MKNKKVSFIDHLESYFNIYLPAVKGLSQSTIVSYKATFRILMEFLYTVKGIPADMVEFSTLDDKLIIEFLNWLETERSCSVSTRKQRLSAISAFSIYAQNRDFDAASVFRSAIIRVPVKKGKQKTRAVFTRQEIKILLGLPDESYETGLRDKVLLSFMYATGARAQEICDLKVRDLRIDVNSASVTLTGKGTKTRQVGIPVKMAGTLQSYIKHKHIESFPNRHIFSSQTHEQMTISCVEGIYKKYVSLAKKNNPELFLADSYPPHSMRHSTACHLLEAGVDIVTIKNILGHVSVQTTQIYAEMSQNTVDQKLREWNETWFGENKKIEIKNTANIPDFLRKR